ncbi:MAG: hypothetical protein LUF26_02800, partial [Firmicutes bacterium]|nr:hypothetical protein [Bacillota bacterium]
MQKRFKGFGVWIAMFIVIYLIYMIYIGISTSEIDMVYSDFVNSVKAEQVTSMVISGNEVTATLASG